MALQRLVFHPINRITPKIDSGRNMTLNQNPENKDYQEYLEWVAAGNTIEEAD